MSKPENVVFKKATVQAVYKHSNRQTVEHKTVTDELAAASWGQIS